MFKEQVYGATAVGSTCEFVDKIIRSQLTGLDINKFEEVKIVFISDLKDMRCSHYLEQPKPMICRKMIRRFFEGANENDYNWLPDCIMNQHQSSVSRIKIPNFVNCKTYFKMNDNGVLITFNSRLYKKLHSDKIIGNELYIV